MLPTIYIRFGYGFLTVFFISLIMLIMEFPLFAWMLFMICFASMGMFVVVIVACTEYKNMKKKGNIKCQK
jgi:hypothetical protein